MNVENNLVLKTMKNSAEIAILMKQIAELQKENESLKKQLKSACNALMGVKLK